MRFRRFSGLLVLIALVAAIYAPPIQMALEDRIASGSSVSPLNNGWSGSSLFASLARDMGYRVVLANSTIADLESIEGRVLYVLMGPDSPLSVEEASVIGSMMKTDELSLLLTQGNRSNNHLLSGLFGFNITGRAIIDPSSPFRDKRVTTARITLDEVYAVQLNVASTIVRTGEAAEGFRAEPIGFSGEKSYDAGDESRGARVVAVAISSEEGLSSIVISDSGVFINSALNSTEAQDTRRFAVEVIERLTRGDRQTTVVIDAAHYKTLGVQVPFTIPPLGMIAAIFLISYLENFNQTYESFLASTPFPLLLLIGGFVLIGTYFGLKRWMGRQPVGIDTPKIPIIESERLIESASKAEIASLKTSGRFYLNTLARLHYVLDEMVKQEFGVSIDRISDEAARRQIEERIGVENFKRLARTAWDLGRIREKAEGQRRFLFPPILSWSRKFKSMTEDTDQVLKAMGTYLVDAEGKVKGVEYKLRKR